MKPKTGNGYIVIYNQYVELIACSNYEAIVFKICTPYDMGVYAIPKNASFMT
jgi:hypothetical protein